MSPAFWHGDRGIFNVIGDLRSPGRTPASRIYLDMGTEEGAVALRDARAMADRLERERAGRVSFFGWRSRAAGTEHDWSRRLGRAIRFFFPSPQRDALDHPFRPTHRPTGSRRRLLPP